MKIKTGYLLVLKYVDSDDWDLATKVKDTWINCSNIEVLNGGWNGLLYHFGGKQVCMLVPERLVDPNKTVEIIYCGPMPEGAIDQYDLQDYVDKVCSMQPWARSALTKYLEIASAGKRLRRSIDAAWDAFFQEWRGETLVDNGDYDDEKSI